MRMILAWFRQALGLAVVLAGALAIWAVWLPSSHPLLDRVGLLAPMERLGLPISRPEPGAPRGGPAGGPPGASPGGPPGGARAVAVVAAPVEQAAMQDRVAAIGNGEALRSVVLLPETAGRVAEIDVSSGDYVAEGAVIARLDSAAEQIARDRAALMLDEARATAARFERLQASGTATEVQIRETALAVRQAELAVRQAEFDLARRVIRAPFAGWVGIVETEIGATVTPSSAVARLDDRSSIIVDFRVPERFVGRINPGDTLTVAPLARPQERLDGRVRTVDSRVDQASRSLRVQAELPNADDSLRAGMAFSIEMAFVGRDYPAVPPLAIQWGNEGAFVWVIREGRAAREPVRIMQRSEGLVLVQGAITPGEAVILEGVQSLRVGTEVAPRPGNGTSDARAARAPVRSDI